MQTLLRVSSLCNTLPLTEKRQSRNTLESTQQCQPQSLG